MLQRVMSRFSVEIFLPQKPKHFAEEAFYAVFQKISESAKVMEKKEGKVSIISFERFCLTVPKNAEGEHFSLSLVSGIEKKWMRAWMGSVKTFRRKFLVSQCRKIS